MNFAKLVAYIFAYIKCFTKKLEKFIFSDSLGHKL